MLLLIIISGKIAFVFKQNIVPTEIALLMLMIAKFEDHAMRFTYTSHTHTMNSITHFMSLIGLCYSCTNYYGYIKIYQHGRIYMGR